MRLIQELRPGTKICVVGEAPGAKEDQTGVPFAGATGSLTFEELGPRAGLERRECSITNVVHIRPPSNDFTRLLRPKPSPHYILGLVQLKADLELLRPNVALAFGGQALLALTKKHSIDKWHGSILPSTLVPGLKVVGTWHPAYTFKDAYDYRHPIERDIAKAVAESRTPTLDLPKRDIIIDPLPDIRDQLVGELLQAEWLTVDIETILICLKCHTPRPPKSKRCVVCGDGRVWHSPRCICFADRPDRIMVLPFGPANDATIAALLRSDVPKNFQNGWAFDLPVLRRAGFDVVNYAWDTIPGFHSIYSECATSDDDTATISGKKRPRQPALRKSLAFQTAWYTREPYYKDDGKSWADEGQGGLVQLYEYNGKDGGVQAEIMGCQKVDLAGDPKRGVPAQFNVAEHTISLLPSCQAIAARGLRVDEDERQRLTAKYEAEIARLQKLLDSIAGKSINTKSPDVKWLLFEHLKMPTKRRSKKTGDPSADKYVIAELAEKHPHPALLTIIEIRERRDMLERYLNVPLGLDGRWRCTWNPTGTRTWRLSSSAYIDGTGGNLQNQPGELRSMFVADPGMALISVDYSQAEYRVTAWEAACEALIELFNDPTRDGHVEAASRVFGIPLSSVTHEQRYTMKRTGYGSIYGMGLDKLLAVVNADAKETGIRIDWNTGRVSQEGFFMLYPEIKSVYWAECRAEVKRSRRIVNVFGFSRLFLGQWSDKFLNEVYAQKPQSTVGILTCRSQVRAYDALDLPGKAQLLINGHDSLVVQAPEGRVPEIAAMLQELMTERLVIKGRELVIPTDVEVGYNWGKRKIDKKTSEVVNPKGLRSLAEWLSSASEV